MEYLKEKTERLMLIDMEKKLLDDHDGSYLKELIEKIQNYQMIVKNKLSIGLSPEEFEVYNQLKKALECAKDTIINFK